MESLSFVGVAVAPGVLHEEIRRRPDIFAEQSTRIRQLLDTSREHHLVLDPVLGWRYRPGYRGHGNQMNSSGLRALREYSPKPAAVVLRIAAFGDSFVYGSEVANEHAWPAALETMHPEIEVLNYGTGGYGTDQAYLRFLQEGATLSPDVVVVGIHPVNLRRAVNVYRRFISDRELPLVKPRFLIDTRGELTLLSPPIQRPADYDRYLDDPHRVIELGRFDQWYEPAIYENPLFDYSATVRLGTTLWVKLRRKYLDRDRLLDGNRFNPSATAFRIQVAVLRRFRAAIVGDRAIPIIVIFPDKDSIVASRQRTERVYDPLLDALRAEGSQYVDLSEAFLSVGPTANIEDWFMRDGHYSPGGNRIVAAWLAERVRDALRAECAAPSRPPQLSACRRAGTTGAQAPGSTRRELPRARKASGDGVPRMPT